MSEFTEEQVIEMMAEAVGTRLNEIEQKVNTMSETNETSAVNPPELTANKEVNQDIMLYFILIILLSFAGQILAYLTLYLSETIDGTLFKILTIGSVNTLVIGGVVKMIQQMMTKTIKNYNSEVKSNSDKDTIMKAKDERIIELEKGKLANEAEILQLKIEKNTPVVE